MNPNRPFKLNANHPAFVYVLSGLLLLILIMISSSSLAGSVRWDKAPIPEKYSPGKRPNDSSVNSMAVVQLPIGRVDILYDNLLKSVPAHHGDLVSAETSIFTGADGNCRIFINQNTSLNIGPDTLISFNFDPEQKIISRFWRGQFSIQSMPFLGGKKDKYSIITDSGSFAQGLGSSYFRSKSELKTIDVVVLSDVLEYHESSEADARKLYPEWRYSINPGEINKTELTSEEKNKILAAVDPQVKSLDYGKELIKEDKYRMAFNLFDNVKSIYPYAADAFYFLGFVVLKQEKFEDTIKYWQDYIRLDPEGAKSKDLSKQLMSVQMMQVKKEIKSAVNMEQYGTAGDLEPDTIAVLPFTNKGDSEYDVLGKGLAAMTISDLSKIPGLKILERARIQALFDEIRLSQSGLVDEAAQLRSGRLLRSEKLVVGDYRVEKGL